MSSPPVRQVHLSTSSSLPLRIEHGAPIPKIPISPQMTSLVSRHKQGSAEDGVGSPFRAPLPCEKRKPKYTSRVPKSTLSFSHYARRKHPLWLRPRSYLLLCNVKIKELVPP